MINISKFVVPALTSTFSAFGIEVEEKERKNEEFHSLTKDINVVVGIVGKYPGMLTYEVDYVIASSFFSMMVPGMTFDINDPMSISAISEMSNMVSGAMFTMINEPGVDITPPTSILGKDIFAVVNTESAEKILFNVLGGELIIGYSFS